MKTRAVRVATRLWDDRGLGWRALRAVLVPASGAFGAATVVRDACYRWGVLATRGVAARTVSIGNLRVGGTGKTPLTRWLAIEARARGVAVAIVSRGYGGRTHGPHVVGDGGQLCSGVEESGDEAVMLARTAGVPVVAGRDRVAAAALAIETFGSRLLLCDDAFQHRRLRRDLDVVLVDGAETGGVARLLPAGPLREPLGALGRAGVVVVYGEGEGRPTALAEAGGRLLVRARFTPATLVRPLGGTWEEMNLRVMAGRRVLAVCGVARPGPFYASLREWEAELVHALEYPDHHAYDVRTWKEIMHAAKDADLVVTTEKDLVKLDRFPFARDQLVALRLGVSVDGADALLGRVLGGAAAGADG